MRIRGRNLEYFCQCVERRVPAGSHWKVVYSVKVGVGFFLQIVHDSRVRGHFNFANTLSRSENVHWKHERRDVRNYCEVCLIWQQHEDSNQRNLRDPMSLKLRGRRWGSLAIDFIVSQPMTKSVHGAITTWVDWFTRRVHSLV